MSIHDIEVCMRQVPFSPSRTLLQPAYGTPAAFLLMSTDQRIKHKVDVMFVGLSADDACLGSPATRMLLEFVVGYEALVLSELHTRYESVGYVADLQLKHLYALNIHGRAVAGYDVARRVDVLSAAVFLFFATTAIIDVVLRETHMRMLHFAGESLCAAPQYGRYKLSRQLHLQSFWASMLRREHQHGSQLSSQSPAC